MTQNVNTSKKNTSKKAKAILAGGLVLGVGAAVTLASWTDQEWANATFDSGKFVLESSVDGKNFESHKSDNELAALKFDFPTDNLTPGEHLVAPYALRLDKDTTYTAEVALAGPVGHEMGLQYGVERVTSIDECKPDSMINTLPKALALAPGSEGEAGKAEILCFHVKTSDELVQGQSASPTWTFEAKSIDRP